jgi:amino acid transporter
MPSIRIIKAIYYAIAIAFHWILFFTNAGNYFHGGTPLEWIALETIAVFMAVVAIRLVPKVSVAEKILVALCVVVPVLSVVWSLTSVIRR